MQPNVAEGEYASIERELHIDASPEVVLEVLSSPEHIRGVWSAETDFEPFAGTASRFTWTDKDSGREESFELVPVTCPAWPRPRTGWW